MTSNDWRDPGEALAELDDAARARVRILALLGALVAAILLAVFGPVLRQPLWDGFHRYSPPPPPSPQIEVVTVDGPSLAAVGGWPWPRYVMARLTEQIAVRGARAIGYDFLFPET